MSAESPKFRVAIWCVSIRKELDYSPEFLCSGGGIGGLCLAVALSRYPDIQLDVYEAAEQFKEIGAGVMIWAKTWRILELLGLAEEASKIAHAPPSSSLGM